MLPSILQRKLRIQQSWRPALALAVVLLSILIALVPQSAQAAGCFCRWRPKGSTERWRSNIPQDVRSQEDCDETSAAISDDDQEGGCRWSATIDPSENDEAYRESIWASIWGAGETITKGTKWVIGGLASGAFNIIVSVIGAIFGLLLWAMTMLSEIIFAMLANILLMLVKFNNFTEVPNVVVVWKAMRDLANMVFIIALLMIAFGTMLRLEHYEWKHLLPKLVLAAIFINFSRAICGLIIDIAQVVMLTFVASFKEAGYGNFQHAFLISPDMFQISIETLKSSLQSDYQAPLIMVGVMLLGWGYIVTAISTIFAMVGMLAYRIVALWVLVMLSPLAFVLSAIPAGEDYAKKWWNEFIHNVIIGPVLAFFIWLVLMMQARTETGPANSSLFDVGSIKVEDLVTLNIAGQQAGSPLDSVFGPIFTSNFDPTRLINIIITVALFAVGMKVAEEIGSAGAKTVLAGAEKISEFGKKAAGPEGAYGFIDRLLASQASHAAPEAGFMAGLGRNTLQYLSMGGLKRGWNQFRERQEKEGYEKAAGQVTDTLFRRWNPTIGLGENFSETMKELSERRFFKDTGLDKATDFLAMIAKLEAVSGRETLYATVAEEREIQEKKSHYTTAGLTAEELSQKFIDMAGKGNVAELQALARMIIAGNNQDDFGRVLKLKNLREMVGSDTRGAGVLSSMITKIDERIKGDAAHAEDREKLADKEDVPFDQKNVEQKELSQTMLNRVQQEAQRRNKSVDISPEGLQGRKMYSRLMKEMQTGTVGEKAMKLASIEKAVISGNLAQYSAATEPVEIELDKLSIQQFMQDYQNVIGKIKGLTPNIFAGVAPEGQQTLENFAINVADKEAGARGANFTKLPFKVDFLRGGDGDAKIPASMIPSIGREVDLNDDYRTGFSEEQLKELYAAIQDRYYNYFRLKDHKKIKSEDEKRDNWKLPL